MYQVTQKLKDGKIKVIEVSWPLLHQGMVLVRNHYSIISAGTESNTIKAARKNLIGKAKERPQQVKQVLDILKKKGVSQTYHAVMKKLDAYTPLGYSCVGEVIKVAPDITEFNVGDYIACGGETANHAEIISVPKNLCVKVYTHGIPDLENHLKVAAYNTLGAIALQGVRQADVKIGDNCAVIGLGLIGQITCQLLEISGVKVFGIDPDEFVLKVAKENGIDYVFSHLNNNTSAKIYEITKGLGVDSVIITAATTSLEPINFAGEITRKKGRVVIVGNVPTGFDRDPYYYKKELEIKMSCSYGPGRYDSNYEAKGNDYPPAYVRWTEQRNMAAFQDLIHSGKLNLSYLTTHEFLLDDASKAYNLILDHNEPYLGVLIRYDAVKQSHKKKIDVLPIKPAGKVNLSFIGAGSYAQNYLLPGLPKHDRDINLKGVMTSSGLTSKRVAEKFGFEFSTSEGNDIFNDQDTNTIFICTRHDSHAKYVLEGIRAGKNIFVEKPLCLNSEELVEIESLFTSEDVNLPILSVGYNRRFSPLSVQLKSYIDSGPVAMIYRINAEKIALDSWIHDPEIGGGRVIGEICHFIDFMIYICTSQPIRVCAITIPDMENNNDTLTINIEFENGSIGTIVYLSNGSSRLSKEYIEIYQGGITGIIQDFNSLSIYSTGKTLQKKLTAQDKGQKQMINEFFDSVKNGMLLPIPLQELFSVSWTTFAINNSLRSRSVEFVQSE